MKDVRGFSPGVHHLSCLDLDPASFQAIDAIICDPPFDPHVHKNTRTNKARTTKGLRAQGSDLGFTSLQETLIEHIAECVKNARHWSLIYTDDRSLGLYQKALGKHYIRTVPWIRFTMPQISGDRPLTDGML